MCIYTHMYIYTHISKYMHICTFYYIHNLVRERATSVPPDVLLLDSNLQIFLHLNDIGMTLKQHEE